MRARLIAATLLVGIVLSPYLVYANKKPMSTEAMFITPDKDRSSGIDRDESAGYLQDKIHTDRVNKTEFDDEPTLS